jgi:uncharacterized protein YkwD
MRKPLVVLGVAATALIAGGIVTTRAMAQEPPDDFSGFTIFEAPSFEAPSPPDSAPLPPPDSGLPQPPGEEGDEGAEPSVVPSRQPAPPAAARPAPPDRSVVAREKPVIKKNYGFAAADPIAASRAAVTAQSISSSPFSPVQQQILALVNRQRQRSGCEPVTIDRRLIDAANRHAADMARRDYFEHSSPNGDRAGERVSESGYRWRWYGENIARGQQSPWDAMDGWMNSPEHRENILDCKLDQMGVGLALDRERTPYWVQDFATPK